MKQNEEKKGNLVDLNEFRRKKNLQKIMDNPRLWYLNGANGTGVGEKRETIKNSTNLDKLAGSIDKINKLIEELKQHRIKKEQDKETKE